MTDNPHQDTARMDWLERNVDRVSGPVDSSPRYIIWVDEVGDDWEDITGDTLREVIDIALTHHDPRKGAE